MSVAVDPVSPRGMGQDQRVDNQKSRGRLSRLQVILFWTVIAAGVTFRLVRYTANFELWLDEIMLGLNIVGRGYRDLFRPLDLNQAAPIGFLIATKFSTSIFGVSEWSMRLWPVLASIVSLPLGWAVFRNSLKPWPALLALSLLACSEGLISYGSEVKQYSVDTAVVLVVIWSAARWQEERGNIRRYMVAWVSLVFGVFFSHPAVFVGFGVLATLLLATGWRGALRSNRREMVFLILGYMVALGVDYIFFLRASVQNHFLLRSNMLAFLKFPVSAEGIFFDSKMFLGHLMNVTSPSTEVGLPFQFTATVVACLLVMAGICTVGRWDRGLSGMAFALGFGVVTLFAVVHKFPALSRTWLFLVPFYCLCIGGAIQVLGELRWKVVSMAAVPLALGLVFLPLVTAVHNALHPTMRYEDFRGAFAHVSAHVKDGDLVYLQTYAEPAFAFYGARDSRFQRVTVVENQLDDILFEQLEITAATPNPMATARGIPAGKEVWLVLDNMPFKVFTTQRDVDLAAFREYGEIEETTLLVHAMVVRVRMGGRETTPGRRD